MTMNTITRVGIALGLVMSMTGCPEEGGTSDTADSAKPKAGSSAAAADGEMTDTQVDQTDIPTEADFEDEAMESITDENYLDELDKLAGEIEADTE